MTDAEAKTVYQAWSQVMASVQAIGKDSRNKSQGFNFRGIDAVMNAAGPAMREHGVIVIPSLRSIHYRDVTSASKGSAMREVTVEVGFTIIGPAGDVIDCGLVPAEALDSGDKATAKAMSVAYRTFLLQALTIPTDETDPDEHSYERASRDTGPAVPLKEAMEEVEARVGRDVDAARQAWQAAGLGDQRFIPRDRLDAALAEAGRIVADQEASADATDAAADSEPEQPEQPELPDNGKKAADEARQKMQPKGEGS